MKNHLFAISFELQITDYDALWHTAAGQAFARYGMCLDGVIDTIGPKEDPQIEDCLTMVFAPSDLQGCLALSFLISKIVAKTMVVEMVN